MSTDEVREIVIRTKERLSSLRLLDPAAEAAVHELLNLVERLVSDQQALLQEVERLRRQLEQKKKAKTTGQSSPLGQPPTKPDSDHSSEQHRRLS